MENVEKLYFNNLTRQKLYDLFGLEEVHQIEELDHWLSYEEVLTEAEENVLKYYQSVLFKNIKDWNEQELSLGFIGPILNLIDFKVPYKLGFFAQRSIHAAVKSLDGQKFELIGKPDGMVAGGGSEPRMPYFAFQEYKKDLDSSGDPIGQNLAAMLAGQVLNKTNEVIYGCYVVGRNWYFMLLKDNKFAISRDYSATHDDDILDIVRILKALRRILLKKIGEN